MPSMKSDVFLSLDKLDNVKLHVEDYSSFVTLSLKKKYGSLVSFHIDTKVYDVDRQEMVKVNDGLEWLRGQLQSCIHQIDSLIDPDQGIEDEEDELDEEEDTE